MPMRISLLFLMNSEGEEENVPHVMYFCSTEADPVHCNLSGSPQEDKPREERMKLGALTTSH